MKSRSIYFRKKGTGLALAGSVGKTEVHIVSVGSAEKHLLKLLENPTFFSKEKKDKIAEILTRINIKKVRVKKTPQELRTINIGGTSESVGGKTPDNED